jgi:hypothetical protein
MQRRHFVLSGLVLAAGCKRQPEHARVDPALASLIPGDTLALAGLRLDLLKKTETYSKLLPEAEKKRVLGDFERRTGINLEDEIHEIVYCLGGKLPVALVRGKFTNGGVANSGLEPQLKIEGGQKFPYKGYMLIGKEETAATFLNSSVVVAGTAAALRDLIDVQAQGSQTPQGLVEMVKQLPPSSHMYMVSDRPKLPEGGVMGFRSLPLELKTVKAHVDMSVGAKLKVEIDFSREGDAKKLNDLVRAGMGLLRQMQKGEVSAEAKLLDSLVMTGEGMKWTAEGEVPLDVMREGLRRVDRMAGGV